MGAISFRETEPAVYKILLVSIAEKNCAQPQKQKALGKLSLCQGFCDLCVLAAAGTEVPSYNAHNQRAKSSVSHHGEQGYPVEMPVSRSCCRIREHPPKRLEQHISCCKRPMYKAPTST